MRLIREIQLPNGRKTANLGFGCAGLLRLPTFRQREGLLRTAVEAGLTHFDVARMYGMGTAEGIVSSALKPFRDQVTLASKFGQPYSTPTGWRLHAQSLARWAFNWSPALKEKIKGLSRPKTQPGVQVAARNNYDVEEMERSLELSLQQLQVDQIDLFFIHEPSRNDLISADLVEALQAKKTAGKIGAFGISTGRAEMEYFLQARPELCREAIQYQSSLLQPGLESRILSGKFTGMFGVLGEDHRLLSTFLSANKGFAGTWSSQLGLDLTVRENVGIIILAIALSLHPHGLVLFFTSKPKRLRHMVSHLKDNSFSGETLRKFHHAVVRELHAN